MTTTQDPATGDALRAYAGQLLAETREELTRADSKAATLFAGVGVVVAVVVGTVASSEIDISALDLWWKLTVTLAAALQGLGLLYLGMALRPQTTKAIKGPLHYYGDAECYLDTHGQPDIRALRTAATAVAADSAARDLEQFAVLAGTVQQKFRRVKRGLYLSGSAAGLLAAVALLRLVW